MIFKRRTTKKKCNNAITPTITNENPDDSKWIKRWSNFMKSLEDN